MLRSFLIIAYRNLFKYKYYSIINILSYAIGLAVFAIAYLYALDELSFDMFNQKAERIYRIANSYEKDSTKNSYAVTPFPMSAALKKEFPEFIENSCRIFNFQSNYHLIQYNNKAFTEKNFFFVDSSILEIFDFKFISGNPKSVLKKPNTIIISKSMKEKYFGDFDPIGKGIIIDDVVPFIVEGVFENFPTQSHVHFDVLTPLSSFFTIIKEPETWLWSPCWTYIVIKNNVNPEKLQEQLPIFVNKYFDEDIRNYSSIYLQPLADIHLNSDLDSEIEPNNKSLYIYILFTISIFLLIVSSLNFINLSIVGSFTRLREISIRKIFSSSRRLIVFQFIIEAVLMGLISFIISLFLVEGFLPLFTTATNNQILISNMLENGIILKILALSIITGIIVGVYTGLYASSFPIFNIGRFKNHHKAGKWFSGKLFILVQYIISLIILIAVFINFRQLMFLKNTNPGFDKDKTIILSVSNNPVAEKYEYFKSLLLKNKNIESVTGSNNIVGSQCSYRRYFYQKNGINKAQFFPELIVRHDFIKTLGLELYSGTDFLKGSTENVDPASSEVIINKSMVQELGFKSNEDAIKKKLNSFKGNEIIIGVVNDFNSRSLHSSIKPLVIRLSQNNFSASEDTKYIFVKLKKDLTKENINFIETTWKSIAPNWPFELKFLHDTLNEQYRDEESLNFFLWIFSFLIIIIGSMGVWAVSSLVSIQRTKEIGIRKAIGATIRDLLKLFFKDFISILIIANLAAWPISWFVLKLWFENFANHIGLQWQYFLYSSLFIMVLTLSILSKHAIKVAKSNTIDSLRDE